MLKSKIWLLLYSFIAFCFVPASVYAIITHDSMLIFAVSGAGMGDERGMEATLTITIEPGTGRVWSGGDPLVGTATQEAERTAVKVAANYFKDINKYDYKFDINSSASLVEGPSAGAAMALLLISMLQDKKLPDYVSITGTIEEDGSVGAVGGVFEKAKKAADSGIKIFMVPLGETTVVSREGDSTKIINLPSYAEKEWGMKVVEVADIDDALKYAYMRPEEIDVNALPLKKEPPFEPEPLPEEPALKNMKELAEKYYSMAEKKLEEASIALENTKIREPGVVSQLLDVLTNSHNMMENAKVLLERNYLYSAANYAFVAYINASFVEDLSNNPSLLEMDTFWLEERLDELENKINELEEQMNVLVERDKLEWLVGAKQRLSWAKHTVEEIKKNLTNTGITIQINNGNITTGTTIFDNLQDYEFAYGWYLIALDFFRIASKDTKLYNIEDYLKQETADAIVEASNALASINGEEKSDIERRVDGAKTAFSMGWYDAALVDAKSAIGLTDAETAVKGMNLNTLLNKIDTELKTLKKKIENSGNIHIWARLFLDHANYFYQKALDYNSKGKSSKALENARISFRLVNMTWGMFKGMEMVYQEFEKLPLEETNKRPVLPVETPVATPQVGGEITEKTPTQQESTDKKQMPLQPYKINQLFIGMLVVLLIMLTIAIIIVVLLIIKSRQAGETQYTGALSKRMDEIHKLSTSADKAFMRGKMSEQQYKELSQKYSEELARLHKEIKERSSHLVQLEKLRAELNALQHSLDVLKAHYQAGEITKEDFENAIAETTRKIKKIKSEITEEEQLIEAENKEIERLKRHTGYATSKDKAGKKSRKKHKSSTKKASQTEAPRKKKKTSEASQSTQDESAKTQQLPSP